MLTAQENIPTKNDWARGPENIKDFILNLATRK